MNVVRRNYFMVRGRHSVCSERLRFYCITHPFQAFAVSNIGLLEWVGCLPNVSTCQIPGSSLTSELSVLPQVGRFSFSSPHTRHLGTLLKSAWPDSFCWGFGFDYTSRMISFMISGFWEPSWILSSVLSFTSFYPNFDSL